MTSFSKDVARREIQLREFLAFLMARLKATKEPIEAVKENK
jgi:hypothetical protein